MNATAKLSLDDRISAAFCRDLPSDDLKALLAEVTKAEASAKVISAAATERALDPATKPADVTVARREKEDAEFALARMATATPRLQERLLKTLQAERDSLAATRRKAALEERDALATELSEFYPPMAEKLADLLRRIDANDRKLGLGEGAEDIARRAPANWRVNPTPQMPSLVRGLRLPAFELSQFSSGYTYDGMRG